MSTFADKAKYISKIIDIIIGKLYDELIKNLYDPTMDKKITYRLALIERTEKLRSFNFGKATMLAILNKKYVIKENESIINSGAAKDIKYEDCPPFHPNGISTTLKMDE